MFVTRAVTIGLVLWLVQAVFLWPLVLAPLEAAPQKSQGQKSQGKKGLSKTSSAKKKAAPASKSTAKAGASKPLPSSKTAVGKRGPVKTTARSSQRQPSQERYQEIQHALSEKGYYQGSVSGAWGPESTEALKKFQRDQKLPEDGKLSSKSIIALGLGPQRTAPAPDKQP